MIKVWCGTCEGKGIIARNNGSYLIECTDCNGKGYTEHEGNSEDLELAAAMNAYFKFNESFMFNDPFGNLTSFTQAQLIEWHRGKPTKGDEVKIKSCKTCEHENTNGKEYPCKVCRWICNGKKDNHEQKGGNRV